MKQMIKEIDTLKTKNAICRNLCEKYKCLYFWHSSIQRGIQPSSCPW